MKTIIIGDIHGRNIWKDIVSKESYDRVIFVGDYFDSFDIPGIDQIYNFNEICNFAKSSPKEVVLLVGNHDLHYMQIGQSYSGFQSAFQFDISGILSDNRDLLSMIYRFDNVVVSHAGVSPIWMNENFDRNWSYDNMTDKINNLFKFRPRSFRFSGWDPYGDDPSQSPVWIRPSSLLKSNTRNSNLIKDHLIQIFGHTQMSQEQIQNRDKWLGPRFFPVDTLEIGYYLVYQDQNFTYNTI